jgi:UPF0755 protein
MSRFLKAALATAGICIVLAVVRLGYDWLAPGAKFTEPRIVSVNKGDSLTVIAHRLAQAGVVRSARATVLFAELTGAGRNLKPGEYAFQGGERLPDILRHLVDGDFIVVTVTIPEGSTVVQIAERLQDAGLVCEQQFEEAAYYGPIPAQLGLGPLGVEGYLFPATYRFSPRATTDQILVTMLRRFYATLTPQIDQRLFELHMSLHDLVTLASIIEKEAKVSGERPTIASVFYNRLRLGMPLQSDPTAQYNPAGDMEPAAAAVRAASAFNTYLFAGFPPGPIANPGMSSIMAALYPAHTDYLYFVARNDGTHIFSRTLRDQEHAIMLVRKLNAAVAASPAVGASRK